MSTTQKVFLPCNKIPRYLVIGYRVYRFPPGSVKNSPSEKVFSLVEQRGHDDLLRNNEDLPVSSGRHCRLRLTDRRKKVKRFARQLSILAFISVDKFRNSL